MNMNSRINICEGKGSELVMYIEILFSFHNFLISDIDFKRKGETY